ncbi:MAG: nitrite reductase, partial [Actinomadura rubrobrunea]|nr:nitrite reductase [Actinomadura rubrobrunea]
MTSADVKIEPRGPEAPPRRPRASWHAAANAVVVGWLALTVAALLSGGRLPAPEWSAAHLFLLGAVTNAIVVWSEHFATALLRLPAPARRWQAARLVALNAGVVAVLCGVCLLNTSDA